MAEMVGPVDFQKNVEYWQQDKWNGQFPVKWHIVKDVPNSQLKYIILENNENKPVTNSRDTQEVPNELNCGRFLPFSMASMLIFYLQIEDDSIMGLLLILNWMCFGCRLCWHRGLR